MFHFNFVRMRRLFNKINNWLRAKSCYVIIDPHDNSVTLSKKLFHIIRKQHVDKEVKPQVFVFKVKHNACFGFMLQHGIKQPTQLCDIQYNDKYKCIGFETLAPSAGRILYDYGLQADKRYKLSVSIHQDATHKTYYQINKPTKYAKKHSV